MPSHQAAPVAPMDRVAPADRVGLEIPDGIAPKDAVPKVVDLKDVVPKIVDLKVVDLGDHGMSAAGSLAEGRVASHAVRSGRWGQE